VSWRCQLPTSLLLPPALRHLGFSPKIEKQSELRIARCVVLAWKKHTKKISKLKDSNTAIDMKVRGRLEKMAAEMADKDTAVSLEFLKEHLHLQKDDDDAIEELKFHLGLDENLQYSVIMDDSDQSVYVYFTKIEE
jgi:hypothetical protein